MDIGGPLVKGIIEKMIHRVDDVLIVGRQFIHGFQTKILLQIAQIHRLTGKLVLGLGNGAFKTEKLIDQPDDIGFGSDHDLQGHQADPCNVFEHLGIKRV